MLAERRLSIAVGNRIWLILAGVVLIFAVAIRVIGLGSESLWIDEAYSISLARYPVAQIIQGTAADQHPPLYYLLLHAWMAIGQSIAFIRLLSALLGTINVAQIMVFGWKVGKAPLGLGAGFLLAISPFHIWYSQEARQYILLAVLTSAASIELWACLHGKKRWWLYTLFSILAIYAQYFAIFVFLAHGLLIVLWTIKEKARYLINSWLISMGAVIVVFLPWLPTAINQFIYHNMPWVGEPAAGDVRDVALRLILGDGVAYLPGVIRWLALAALLVIAAWVIYRYISIDKSNRWGFAFISTWALLPFAVISIVSLIYPIFQIKQYLLVLAPLLLMAAGITVATPRPWGGLLLAGLVLLAGTTTVFQQSVLSKDDWRGAANYIDVHKQTGDMVFGNPSASSLALSLYWQGPLPFNGYPPNYSILTGGWVGQPLTQQSVEGEMAAATQGYQRVWLVEFSPQYWDAHEYLSTWLADHGSLIDNQSFGRIHVRLYELTR